MVQFESLGNARSLTPIRALCPFTPKPGANGDPKTRAHRRGFGMTIAIIPKLYHYRALLNLFDPC